MHAHGRIFARVWAAPDTTLSQGPAPIVLFHDSLGCVELWRDFPVRLAAATGRAVIGYDRLGFGRSDARFRRPSRDFIIEEAESYFPAVRAQLGFTRFIALGHSVGGSMAMHCAARYPRECEALITLAAQACVEKRTLEGIQAARELFTDPVQFSRLERYHGNKATWVLDAWTGIWLADEFACWTLGYMLSPVPCPALVIHGSLDEYGSHRQPELIAQLCSGYVDLRIIADTYHVPHREQSAKVLGHIGDFLAIHTGRSGH